MTIANKTCEEVHADVEQVVALKQDGDSIWMLTFDIANEGSRSQLVGWLNGVPWIAQVSMSSWVVVCSQDDLMEVGNNVRSSMDPVSDHIAIAQCSDLMVCSNWLQALNER